VLEANNGENMRKCGKNTGTYGKSCENAGI